MIPFPRRALPLLPKASSPQLKAEPARAKPARGQEDQVGGGRNDGALGAKDSDGVAAAVAATLFLRDTRTHARTGATDVVASERARREGYLCAFAVSRRAPPRATSPVGTGRLRFRSAAI